MITTFQDILEFMKGNEQFPFYKNSRGCIRARDKNNLVAQFCPITAFVFAKTGERYMMANYPEAAYQVGLDSQDAVSIADAADDLGSESYRIQMLEAIGAEAE